MQKIIFCAAVAVLALSCNNAAEQPKTEEVAKAAEGPKKVDLPYTATYSSSFEPGNPDYMAVILKGSWKDWDNNTMDNMKDWVADSIIAFHSDNTVVQGIDSLLARWKRGRAEYSTVLDTVQAVTPLYSTDQKHNWVLVWVKSINTKKDGVKDTSYVQETWRLNKDGKADMLLQYDRAPRKK